MKIAILISGRLIGYEVCLIPFLENIINHDIDLFISINDNDSEYYTIAKQQLSKWLKSFYIQKFEFPENFNHTPKKFSHYKLINGEYRPYNALSMYFNDNKAFQLMEEYSKTKNITYDIIMKFRSDIITSGFPDINNFNPDIIYSVVPNCFFKDGLYNQLIISDIWLYGSINVMKIYCNTYNFLFDILNTRNGDYYIAGEACPTDNCYINKINVEYFNIKYNLDYYRHMYILDNEYCKDSETDNVRINDRNNFGLTILSSTPDPNISIDAKPYD